MSIGNDLARFDQHAGPSRERSPEHEATIAALNAALLREEELKRATRDLLKRQNLLTQEFEHRLVNGLQLIVSLLTLQSRAATTPEVAKQLSVAAERVAAIGRVHSRLHLLDHEDSVELKSYLEGLCDDLVSMLFQDREVLTLAVTGVNVRLPSALGIPLGFIVNELIINAVKYATGHIVLDIATSGDVLVLSVTDDGPGLPADFNPAASRGLGMKIIRSLVAQIGGALTCGAGDDGRGARFTVTLMRAAGGPGASAR